MQRVDSTTDLTRILDDGTTSPETVTPEEGPFTYKDSIIKLVTGSSPNKKASNPTYRLKLFLLISFVGLHVLNLCTTLTTRNVMSGYTAVISDRARVDTSSPAIVKALAELSGRHPLESDIVAQIASPLFLQFFVPGISSDSTSDYPFSPLLETVADQTPLASLDRFMTSWTRFVGDPVMSKWIVIILAISLFLNGYLLKGIAIGTSRAEAAESAARILLAATGQITLEEKPGKLLRRHSSTTDPFKTSHSIQQARRPQPLDLATVEEKNSKSRSNSEGSEEQSPVQQLTMAYPRARRPTAGNIVPPSSVSNVSTDRDRRTSESGMSSSSGLQPLRHQPSIEVTTPSARSDVSSFQGSFTPATTVDDFVSDDGPITPRKPRGLDECVAVFASGEGAPLLSDEEIILLVQKGKVAAYALEKVLKDHQRAVRIRRALICKHCFSLDTWLLLMPSLSSGFFDQNT